LFDDLGIPVNGDHDLYFQTDGEYHTEDLLKLVREENLPTNSHTFGSIINHRYLESGQTPQQGAISFEKWLASDLQVLEFPRLADPKDYSKLSRLFLFVIEKHPERMLGILKANKWSNPLFMDPTMRQKISDAMLDTNIGRRPLGRTYLPSKELEIRCSNFIGPRIFPSLTLDVPSKVEEWKFLEKFGVGVEINLEFYLEILRQYKHNNTPASYEIYEAIQKKIWASENQSEAVKHLQYV
jgi:hypothetical protein